MACVWNHQLLQPDHGFIQDLPVEAAKNLLDGSNVIFLDTLAQLALNPALTDIIFATYEPLFPELFSRWLAHVHQISHLRIVSAAARLLSYCPSLRSLLKQLTMKHLAGKLELLARKDPTSLTGLNEEDVVEVLVTVSRLLTFDYHSFGSLISPSKLQVLLTTGNAAVKYMAAKVLGQILCWNETRSASIGDSAIGDQVPEGLLDGRLVNFVFFSLWEDSRAQRFSSLLAKHRILRKQRQTQTNENIGNIRHISPVDLSPSVINLGGYLHTLQRSRPMHVSTLIMTPTTQMNVHRVAEAVDTGRPVLVTGLSGAGKTMIVREIAAHLGKLSEMLVLHLNEQTDAKLLVGVYTSDTTAGSFKWQPGVLTTAVEDGRWVYVEDLDRAPAEVLSILLPLLERRELYIPNLGRTIIAATGFQLIASKKTMVNSRGEEVALNEHQIGHRLWTAVHASHLTRPDLEQIVRETYSILPQKEIIDMYYAIRSLTEKPMRGTRGAVRHVGVSELMKFCSRYQALLAARGIRDSTDPIPEFLYEYIFLEAVDCFCAADENLQTRDEMASVIAASLLSFQVSPTRSRHCLYQRLPEFDATTDIMIGRARLSKHSPQNSALKTFRMQQPQRFALTGPALRLMESVAIAVKMQEPCLLVGETGVGKTTVVQQLATQLHKPLMVVNLSQQSEVSDLLGGIKPLSARSLAVPLKESFDDLFASTNLSSQNTSFATSIERALQRGDWNRLANRMQAALELLKSYSDSLKKKSESQPTKKRKLLPSKLELLQSRLESFTARLNVFKQHIANEDRGLVFEFVEGDLVKAVRHGGWVLLDEINMASPDTLECLADLLYHGPHMRPFLLLTEAGNVQKIEAHPEFRLFAAMNPATDIGKRDLPPGIRSRFTEIFVHSPDQDKDSLQEIARAYLSGLEKAEKKSQQILTREKCVRVYQQIRLLEDKNEVVDGAGQKPHFTLRSLTRALTFASSFAPLYGNSGALYHGFAMCFLTVLDSDSKLKVDSILQQELLNDHSPGAFRRPKRPNDGNEYVDIKNYWIRTGSKPPTTPEDYILTNHITRNLQDLARATLSRRYPILLQGPTSSGKTSLIEYLAKRSGNEFIRINNHEHTDLQEYLGSYVSTPDGLLYQDGVLVQGLRKGHWVVLDELNLAPTDILEALNRLLDDNRELRIPETQEVIKPHPNFMLFATQNPPGLYGGRKVLSRAFRNRFLELHFNDVPEDELEKILKQRCRNIPESFCNKIVKVYKKLYILRRSERMFEQKNSFATLRDLFRWALRSAGDAHQLAVDGFLLLGERVRDPKERLMVKQVIEEVMGLKIDLEELYGPQVMEASGHLSVSQNSVVWTKSARRLYVLLRNAIVNEEPVLLVGDTGCGKTQICQVLAAHHGRNLKIVNAHQHTETGDLIGSQRPIRDRIVLESKLNEMVDRAFVSIGSDGGLRFSNQDDCAKELDQLPEERKSRIPVELMTSIEATRTRLNLLFEWSDGSLVQAMKEGEYFLLDEISLADDSVLERLNSVLEPARTVLLAEKGSINASVKAAPNFRFLATMNPAGDYGKKELSPALRNRFTEIWIPSLSPKDDVLPIIEAKLGGRFEQFAAPMLQFARWFAETFGRGTDDLSIRDMLAWTEFLNSLSSEDDARLLLVHGASLVYIDRLGTNPSALFSTSNQSVRQQRLRCFQSLSHILGRSIQDPETSDLKITSDLSRFGIGPFVLSKEQHSVAESNFNFQAHTTRTNAFRLLRALRLSKPILLEGSPGVGKTALVIALAESLGKSLIRTNLSDQTDMMDLCGNDVPAGDDNAGHFLWRDGPFLQAMKEGRWVLLDEMNLASQSVLEGLNACLDHRGEVFIPELGRSFKKHPGFVLFAAQNPQGQGGGRKGLPASFVNRFTVVHAEPLANKDYDVICADTTDEIRNWDVKSAVNHVVRAQELAAVANFRGGPWEFNLRDVLRWKSLVDDRSGLLANTRQQDFTHMMFLDGLRSRKDKDTLKSSFQAISRDDDVRHSHYRNLGKSWYQCGFGVLGVSGLSSSQDLLSSQPHAAKELETVSICIQKAWPVVLVGDSGTGKSSLLSHLATTTGSTLLKLSLNPDTDAYDLLGGYQQSDTYREVPAFVSSLKHSLRRWYLTSLEQIGDCKILDALWDTLADADHLSPKVLLSQLSAILMKLKAECGLHGLDDTLTLCDRLCAQINIQGTASFEWVDGVLVQAIKAGAWIEFENANLCSSSVLDRLNALLEPGGSLTIHEHCEEDGSPVKILPHSNFRLFLTMDPRHGELSRAMRNRCVEVYLDSDNGKQAILARTNFASDLFRYQAFQAFNWPSISQSEALELVRVCFENLSYRDYQCASAWFSQLSKGMVIDVGLGLNALGEVLQAFCVLVNTKDIRLRSSTSFNDKDSLSAQPSLLADTDWRSEQPVHPNANAALIPKHEADIGTSLRYSRWMEILWDLSVDMTLASSRLSSWLRQRQESHNFSSQHSDDLMLLASSIRGMQQNICEWMWTLRDDFPTKEADVALRRLCNLLERMSQLIMVFPFDQATFFALTKIGRLLSYDIEDRAELDALALLWSKFLHELQQGRKSLVGGSMDLLWRLFKPHTPDNLEHMRFVSELRKFADEVESVFWRSETSIEQMDRLRRSIFELMASSHPDTRSTQLQILRETLTLEQADAVYLDEPSYPHFMREFEGIRQYYYLNDRYSGWTSALDVLAGRSTRSGVVFRDQSPAAELLSRLSNLTGINTENAKLLAAKQTIPLQILQRLYSADQCSIGSMDLFEFELSQLGTHVAGLTDLFAEDSLKLLNKSLVKIQCFVLTAHGKDMLSEQCGVDMKAFLSGMISVGSQRSLLPSGQFPYDESQFERELPSLQLVPELARSNDVSTAFTLSASTWVRFFTALLSLYISDLPDDPALTTSLRHAQWLRQTAKIDAKLSALRHYEQYLTGEKSNYRCKLVEDELHEFEKPPDSANIARPIDSRLNELCAEMTHILKSILHPVLQLVGHNANGRSLETVWSLEDAHVIQDNITHAIRRLNGTYDDYEDIVAPLVSMLHGLATGLELASVATGGSSRNALVSSALPSFFCGFDLRTSTIPSQTETSIKVSDHLRNIESVTLKGKLFDSSINHYAITLKENFESVFLIWQRQLKSEQEEHASKTSLYRYTGESGVSEDQDAAELQELFQYDAPAGATSSSRQTADRLHTSGLAQTMFDLQERLVQTYVAPAKLLEDLVRSSAQNHARVSEAYEVSHAHQLAVKMLPALMLEISTKQKRLNPGGENGAQYDFYHDFNPPQLRRLRQLLFKVRRRFVVLRHSWPDHVAIADAITAVHDLLNVSMSEPLSKFLSRIEHLHGLINEWQSVASREHSAIEVYTDLTTLIIDWRRLELSTWRKLLDFEDTKSMNEAKSWWFIAYKLIVHAPLHSDRGSALDTYVVKMLGEMKQFLSTTSCGVFSRRLQLLGNFVKYAALMANSYPNMGAIISPLTNLLNFYRGYEADVNEVLDTGRKQLAKDMDQVVTLASWKDTNIVALRDSALKSHRKLLKVLRRYRSLLGRSVDSIVSGIYRMPEAARTLSLDSYKINTAASATLLQAVQAGLKAWHELPVRFTTNNNVALEKMRGISLTCPAALEAAAYLQDFGSSLLEEIDALRKETPTVRNEKNESQIKNIKKRKTMLYNETLRKLRRMGFNPNVDVKTLSKQHGLPMVFSRARSNSQLETSEQYLFRYLSNMEQIRVRAKDHSDDITEQQVTRGLGFLEAILKMILAQRRAIVKHLRSIQEFDQVLEPLVALQHHYTDVFPKGLLQRRHDKLHNMDGRMKWTYALLTFSDNVLEKHEQLGEKKFPELRNDIQTFTERLDQLLKVELNDSLSILDLETHAQNEARELCVRTIESLQKSLQSWKERDPSVIYIVDEILTATSEGFYSHMLPAEVSNDSNYDASPKGGIQTTSRMMQTVDAVLSKMQRIGSTINEFQVGVEEKNWYISVEQCFAVIGGDLGLKALSMRLKEVLQALQDCDKDDQSTEALFCALQGNYFLEFRGKIGRFVEEWHDSHRSLCQMAQVLSDVFKQMLNQGLCLPAEKSSDKNESSKLEEGTGLGEGEGSEDISKDIANDEDLSELAQQKGDDSQNNEMDAEEDAVDMADEDFEADMEDGDDTKDGKDGTDKDDDSDDGAEEEVGSVNDGEDDAIDEKFWDGEKDEQQETKESRGEQAGQQEDAIAEESGQTEANEDAEQEQGENEDVAQDQDPAENNELDNYVEEGENLDLPDNMNIEGMKEDAMSEDSILDDISEDDHEQADGDIETKDDGSEIDQDMPRKDEATGIDDEDEARSNDHTSDLASNQEGEVEEEENIRAADKQQDTSKAQLPDKDDMDDAEIAGGLNPQENQAVVSENTAPEMENPAEAQEMDTAKASDSQQHAQAGGMQNGVTGEEEGEQDGRRAPEDEQPLTRLAEELDKFHRFNKEIQNPSKKEGPEEASNKETADSKDFEDLPDENTQADAQAMGTATEEQAFLFDREAMEAAVDPDDPVPVPREIEELEEGDRMEDIVQNPEDESAERMDEESFPLVSEMMKMDSSLAGQEQLDLSSENSDVDMLPVSEDHAPGFSTLDPDTAQQLWTYCETATRDLALALTEQLRLILAPTQASKLRGDFRTGKRLNIKRIIPYIASQYKRDKIWMRRTVPSKRNYQVLLAVDDSLSMKEGGAGRLALEALTLVSRSLSMLEVGQICVVKFGEDFQVAHPFDRTFSSEAGAQVFERFTFQQKRTDVKKLISESLSLLQQARITSSTSPSNADLWQLQLIISDGFIPEGTDAIRRMVRQAQEERIMTVFVIVDKSVAEGQSILDQKHFSFEPDDNGVERPVEKSYGESFPFSVYLIVRNVRDLPNVLATALKQWFAEVAEA